MHRISGVISRASLLALLAAGVAGAGVITFDTYAKGTIIDTQYAAQGVIFAGGLTVLDDTTAWGGVTTIPDPPNYAQITSIVTTITFQNGSTPLVTDFVSYVNLGLTPGGGSFTGYIAEALDLGGNVIASQTINRVDPPNGQSVSTTSFSVPGIHALRFTLTEPYNGLAAFDTLTFNDLTPASGVPEPSSLVLLVLGMLPVGYRLSRARRV